MLGDFCSNGCLPQSRLRLRLFWIFCKEFACVWTATLGPRSSPFVLAVGRIHHLNCKGSQVGRSLPPSERVPFITRPDRMRETKRCIFYQRKIIETKRCHMFFNCCCTPLFFACDATRLGDSTVGPPGIACLG